MKTIFAIFALTLISSGAAFADEAADTCVKQARERLRECRKASWRELSTLSVSSKEVACNGAFLEKERACRRNTAKFAASL